MEDVVDELLGFVGFLLLVIEEAARTGGPDADEGALGTAYAAQVLVEAVEFLDKAAGLADQILRGWVAD